MKQMACDHGMMLMSDHDDAYVDAMLMVSMQANTRSVTACVLLRHETTAETLKSILAQGRARGKLGGVVDGP